MATVRFIPSPLSPYEGAEISSSEGGSSKKEGSIGSIGPRSGGFAPFAHNVSHVNTDKGTQIPREKICFSVDACFRDARVSHNVRPTYSHVRALREFVRACVREGWQLRREISYEITGSHCRGGPPSLPPPPVSLRGVDH